MYQDWRIQCSDLSLRLRDCWQPLVWGIVETPVKCVLGFITARKRSLGQGNIFTPVCHSVHRGGVRGCCQWGVCMVASGGGGVVAWGACVVALGGGCVWYTEIRSISGWYASYWNAFLLII